MNLILLRKFVACLLFCEKDKKRGNVSSLDLRYQLPQEEPEAST
jgi:hypothetical protein